jgi:predicted extracellular nuclease
MAGEITIASFNVENLFTRYNFKGKKTGQKDHKNRNIYRPYTPKELQRAVRDGFIIDREMFKTALKPSRALTARAIKALKANILGLQEIENLDTLKRFNSNFLKSKKFKYQMVIDGNDNRFIDVGLLSDIPPDFVRTHQFLRSGRSRIFSRDCLEIHFNINHRTLVVFVNHFKSMMGGRSRTRKRREIQCEAVLNILKERFGSQFGNANFVILGDLNDYMEMGKENESGIRKLLQSDQMENVLERLPAPKRWTHFYSKTKDYRQLDYILVSKSLALKNPAALPYIERRGQPLRVNPKNKPPVVPRFFKEVKGKAKASDHCPVSITLQL